MEQAESNPDSLRVFTTERWFVQLGMVALGIACCSKCDTSCRTVMQVPAFKLPAYSRVTGYSELTAKEIRNLRLDDNSTGISSLASLNACACPNNLIDVTLPNQAVRQEPICFGIGGGFPSRSANPRVLSLCEVADSPSQLVKKHCTRRPVRSMMRRRRRAPTSRLAARSQPNAQA